MSVPVERAAGAPLPPALNDCARGVEGADPVLIPPPELNVESLFRERDRTSDATSSPYCSASCLCE